MRSIVIFRFFSHLSLLFVYQCITFLPLIFRFSFYIRNITLGYTLPSAWTKVAYMDRVRIYGSLENFFTFTKWKGYDPEIDGITYPTMRQAVIGVNVTF